MFAPIETPRLILRCVEPKDASDLSWLVTPGVTQWVASWGYPFTLAMAQERIASARAMAAMRTAVPLVVTAKADEGTSGKVMGWVGLVSLEPGRGLMGYWLGEQFHGRGFMREAARPALRFAFEYLNVPVVEAQAQLSNAGSFAVMKSCGMTYMGKKTIFAPARQVYDRCAYYEIERTALMAEA